MRGVSALVSAFVSIQGTSRAVKNQENLEKPKVSFDQIKQNNLAQNSSFLYPYGCIRSAVGQDAHLLLAMLARQ